MVAARVFFLAFAALFATAMAGDITFTYQTFTNRNCSGSAFTTQEWKGTPCAVSFLFETFWMSFWVTLLL
jgi:hypothetical protein